MKRITPFIFTLLIIINLSAQSLSKDERKKAIESLKSTQIELLSTVKDLSTNQLNFKPDSDTWSIAECLEHIAISENNIFGIVLMTLKEEADPSRRVEVKMSDEELETIITSREQKVKTRAEFEPSNSYGSFDETLKAFKDKRKSNIKYVKSTNDDLRNRYFQFPFGVVDSYQVILFMSGHTKRHIDQIKEVMTNASFPSN